LTVGKAKYETTDGARGYMFAFKHRGTSLWRDATEELPGPGRLINHSRCHANVSKLLQIRFQHTLSYCKKAQTIFIGIYSVNSETL